jgi:predicted ATPase
MSVAFGLPRQLTSFVGREAELEQLAIQTAIHPLVTLVGAGGVGKTRLALEAAVRHAPNFVDRIRLVDLAPLADSMLVPQAVAAAFGLHERATVSVRRILTDHLAASEVLLVLDNCEHVIDACAAIVVDLLQGCPGVHILATSREPLGVHGEFTWRVPSLARCLRAGSNPWIRRPSSYLSNGCGLTGPASR